MRVSMKLSTKETDGSIQAQVTTFITQRTNLNRRAVLYSQQYPLRESTDIGAKKKEILDAAEIMGRKSTLYNQILGASLPKDLNCIALKVLCYFSLFQPLQVVKILSRLNHSSTVSFEASQAEFGKPSTVKPTFMTRHRIQRSTCM